MNLLSFYLPHTNGIEIGIDNSFSFQLASGILVEAFPYALQWNTTKNRKKS